MNNRDNSAIEINNQGGLAQVRKQLYETLDIIACLDDKQIDYPTLKTLAANLVKVVDDFAFQADSKYQQLRSLIITFEMMIDDIRLYKNQRAMTKKIAKGAMITAERYARYLEKVLNLETQI